MASRSEPPSDSAAILAVRDLVVAFRLGGREVRALDGIDLTIGRSETVALVGESGSGKTMTALSLLGLNPPGSVVTGSIRLDGRELLGLPERHLRTVRGAQVSMIFQEPVTSLNPVIRIGDQLEAAIRAHQDVGRREARSHGRRLLAEVGIPEPSARMNDYPHQWSGGMCQRAMIAIALANEPVLVIADEPTTALDVTVQAQVLRVFRRVQHTVDAALLLITHDLGVVAETADRVAVVYAGRIVEEGATADVLRRPLHHYTAGLISSIPPLDGRRTLDAIGGQPPSLVDRPGGCAFHPRCPVGRERGDCAATRPVLIVNEPGRRVACHAPVKVDDRLLARLTEKNGVAVSEPVDPADLAGETTADGEALLTVSDLVVRYPVRSGLLGLAGGHVEAVRGVSFGITAGRTLGLVGESGCGKTTIARAVTRLVDPHAGRILLDGNDITRLPGRALREVRRGVQLVFQDPFAALDPRVSIGDSIAEPFVVHRTASRAARPGQVDALLDLVGLSATHARRFPHELSGGQLQRVNIARALALEPRLIVLDEPVSSLDVSIQAQILTLFRSLQAELGVAFLFISHDLSVVRQVSDEVGVMYLGRIVERAETDELFDRPRHPYTRSLLDAVPRIGSGETVDRIVLEGDIPDPSDHPGGCAFRGRCWRASAECETVDPPLVSPDGVGHATACHHPLQSEPVSGSVGPVAG